MRTLYTHRGPILPLQRGMLRRHRWYCALGEWTRHTRIARSHAAAYRAINQRQRALHELARQDRTMWEHLSRHSNRFHSVNDPIEAEVYRIRCELYNVLAAGTDTEQAFERHYEQARVACERFNAGQERLLGKWQAQQWTTGIMGHFSPDEAWQRLRHAVRMYQQILRTR